MTAHASSFLTCAASKSPFQLSILGVISGVFRLCKRRNFTSGKKLPDRTTVRYCHVSGCAISWSTSPFNRDKKLLICTLQQRGLDFLILMKKFPLLLAGTKKFKNGSRIYNFSSHYITRTRKRQNYHPFQNTSSKTPFTYCLFSRVFTPSFLQSF